MVDHPGIDLAGVDGLQNRIVAAIVPGACLERIEPVERGLFAFQFEERTDDRLEVRSCRGGGPAADPLRLGQLQQRLRQFGLFHPVLVVDEHSRAGRDTDPATLRCPERRCDLGNCARVDGGKEPGMIDQHHGWGVFGQENIGRGGFALLDDLVAQFDVVTLAQGDLDSGIASEALAPGFGQRFVLGVVDHDALVVGCRVCRADAQQRCSSDCYQDH